MSYPQIRRLFRRWLAQFLSTKEGDHEKIQGALVIVSSLLVFGLFSGIAMAQALVEFALSGM